MSQEINTEKIQQKKTVNPFVSLLPIIVLILMMVVVVILFGNDALSGGSQISLLVSTALCICISLWYYDIPWKQLENGMKDTIRDASTSIVILLLIGMMSASWMICGVVPTLIYYGVQIVSPVLYLFVTCIICAAVSVMTGSSWTTIATIGVALIGIGTAIGIPVYWAAGAIISGAYFGDKISPLSDTTILASAVADVNIFTHVKYMMRTTLPSICITLAIFLVAGFVLAAKGNSVDVDAFKTVLESKFNINPLTLFVPVVTGIMIAKKVPSLIILFLSSVLAAVTALYMQPDLLREIAGDGCDGWQQLAKGTVLMLTSETHINTGYEVLDDLVSTGGMFGMMKTVWLILCAMCFGGVMVASGMLQSITKSLISCITGRRQLVGSTLLSGIFMNLLTCDQYISIILTTNIFNDAYKDLGYEKKLLSRSTEDSATVTSVLIPWNSCGMTQAMILGVPTLLYLPFCFFNYISPLMSFIYAWFGWTIKAPSAKPSDTVNK